MKVQQPPATSSGNMTSKTSSWDSTWGLCKFLFLYTLPIFKLSGKRGLKQSDFSAEPEVDKCQTIGKQLQVQYNFEQALADASKDDDNKDSKSKPASRVMLRALARTFGFELFIVTLVELINCCLFVNGRCLALYILLQDTQQTGSETQVIDKGQLVTDVCLLLGAISANWLLNHGHEVLSMRLGMRCRIASSFLIYNKSLKLSQIALASSDTADVTNLLSNDVNRFDGLFCHLTRLVTAPIHAIIMIYMLASLFIGGWPTLASIVILLLLIGAQTIVSTKFGAIRQQVATQTDKRVRLFNETIKAIQVIKYHAWEQAYEQLIVAARTDEIQAIKRSAMFRALLTSLSCFSNVLTAFTAIASYILLGGTLSPVVVLSTLCLASLLRESICGSFPMGLAASGEIVVVCSRIDKFLELAENTPKELQAKPTTNSSCQISIETGELVLIVGRVGAGKTTLLLSLLNELPLSLTTCCVIKFVDGSNKTLSYAPQEAWIFPGSIRDNILLTDRYDPARYNEVLACCCLRQDFQLMPNGDLTQVGERGAALSGGQKARVSLARALYRRADAYLLDDPLAAVDAKVASHIFDQAILGFLKDKTVLLATHQLQFLRHANRVLLVAGTAGEQAPLFGTLAELVENKTFDDINFGRDAFEEALKLQRDRQGKLYTNNYAELGQNILEPVADLAVNVKDKENQTTSRDVALYFIKCAFPSSRLARLLLLILSERTLYHFLDFLVSIRSNIGSNQTGRNKLIEFVNSLEDDQFCGIYSALVLSYWLLVFAALAYLYLGCLHASKLLHNNLIASLLRVPIKFYDSNPIGQVQNRVCNDIGSIDEVLPVQINPWFVVVLHALGTLTLCVLLEPINLIAISICMLAVMLLAKFCFAAIIECKHLEAKARSSVFSHLASTVNGLVIIRCFQVESRFSQEFNKRQDSHTRAWFGCASLAGFMTFTIDACVMLLISFTVSLMVGFRLDSASGQFIGLIIFSLITLLGTIQFAARQTVLLASLLTGVKRLQDYIELKPEQKSDKKDDEKRNCPSDTTELKYRHLVTSGQIEFKKVSIKYDKNRPLALREISFCIKPGEKVGVIGRTGAGKSSLIATILRLYSFDGIIELDGQNNRHMNLAQLRSSISIIPQDPVLFSGSLRRNLDPVCEHSDEQIWAALGAVQLQSLFAESNGKLDFELSESGSNLSIGQRHLVCLARALLKRNKILILDEATANVDPETDALIQATVKQQFANCTVLTIAHRLVTILDSDRVLVLEGGRLVEFASPIELAADPGSLFSQMIDAQSQQAKALRNALIDSK